MNNNPLEQGVLDNLLRKREEMKPESTPVVSEKTIEGNRTVATPMKAEIAKPHPSLAIKYPNKPQGWDDDTYGWSLKNGYTPESIKELTNIDPNKGVYESIYKSSITKPKPIDEKKVRNAKLVGSIGDSLGLLAQLWSAGKGAHIQKRDYGQSASAQLSKREKELRELYDRESKDYTNGLYNSRVNDLNYGTQQRAARLKELRSLFESKLKRDQKEAENKRIQGNSDRDFGLKEQTYKDNLGLQEEKIKLQKKSLEETKRHNVVGEKIASVNAASNSARTKAYINNTGSGKGGGYEMIIEANPKDPNYNNYGKDKYTKSKIIKEKLTKGQIDQYAREALSNLNFIHRHPELVLQKPDILGKGSMKYKPNADIAATYLKEKYDNGFSSSEEYHSPIKAPDWDSLFKSESKNNWIDDYDNSQFQINGF